MTISDYLQSFGIIILFFVILWGAYYLSKTVGQMQTKRQAGSNMTIIEVLPVGPQKTIQLVRVGTRYMVIGVTKDHIAFIQDIDENDVKITRGNENVVPFSNFLSKLMHKEKGNDNGGEEMDEHQEK